MKIDSIKMGIDLELLFKWNLIDLFFCWFHFEVKCFVPLIHFAYHTTQFHIFSHPGYIRRVSQKLYINVAKNLIWSVSIRKKSMLKMKLLVAVVFCVAVNWIIFISFTKFFNTCPDWKWNFRSLLGCVGRTISTRFNRWDRIVWRFTSRSISMRGRLFGWIIKRAWIDRGMVTFWTNIETSSWRLEGLL